MGSGQYLRTITVTLLFIGQGSRCRGMTLVELLQSLRDLKSASGKIDVQLVQRITNRKAADKSLAIPGFSIIGIYEIQG